MKDSVKKVIPTNRQEYKVHVGRRCYVINVSDDATFEEIQKALTDVLINDMHIDKIMRIADNLFKQTKIDLCSQYKKF